MTTTKTLNLKRKNGLLIGRPFFGTRATVEKTAKGYAVTVEFNSAVQFVDGTSIDAKEATFDKQYKALAFIAAYGDKLVKSENMMSNKEITIPLRDRGGCCDPATERYWSM